MIFVSLTLCTRLYFWSILPLHDKRLVVGQSFGLLDGCSFLEHNVGNSVALENREIKAT